MSDFKTKMHQIQFRLGLRPRPMLGELTSVLQSPQLDLRAYFQWETGEGMGGGRDERGKDGKGKGNLLQSLGDRHPC